MNKTLVVTFTPRGERSATKKIVDAFLAEAAGKTEIVHRDLVQSPPKLMLGNETMSYIMRDMVGEKKAEYDATLEEFDALVAELNGADKVVLAFPMWNFSVPAVVKAWFDAVMLKGHTWDMQAGAYTGPLNGKQAVVIATAGGDYEGTPMAGSEHARSLAVGNLKFMGCDVAAIYVEGVNARPDDAAGMIETAAEEARKLAEGWYA